MFAKFLCSCIEYFIEIQVVDNYSVKYIMEQSVQELKGGANICTSIHTS